MPSYTLTVLCFPSYLIAIILTLYTELLYSVKQVQINRKIKDHHIDLTCVLKSRLKTMCLKYNFFIKLKLRKAHKILLKSQQTFVSTNMPSERGREYTTSPNSTTGV